MDDRGRAKSGAARSASATLIGRLATRAPAKVNLTLHVLGRRLDGYHELDSIVAFAGIADHLTLQPGPELTLIVDGPLAAGAGATDDNLVLRAARALAARHPGLRTGAFHLIKRLPAAAGIGGGSSDAAAALRLLATANGLTADHLAVNDAACATGADVPVCLDPRARAMRGAGERIGQPLNLPPLFAVLVNPGVAVPTPAVFQALGLAPGESIPGNEARASSTRPHSEVLDRRSSLEGGLGRELSPASRPPSQAPQDEVVRAELGSAPEALIESLSCARNDLERPALAIAPAIGYALDRLAGTEGCGLARMSGSGATVFGLYGDRGKAVRAARTIRGAEPGWWVRATILR